MLTYGTDRYVLERSDVCGGWKRSSLLIGGNIAANTGWMGHSSFFWITFLSDQQWICSCHWIKTSFSEWVGFVQHRAEWSPDVSVFVGYVKPVPRPRACNIQGRMPGRENERLQLSDRGTDPQLNIFYCLRMCCFYKDPLLKLLSQRRTLYFNVLWRSWQFFPQGWAKGWGHRSLRNLPATQVFFFFVCCRFSFRQTQEVNLRFSCFI